MCLYTIFAAQSYINKTDDSLLRLDFQATRNGSYKMEFPGGQIVKIDVRVGEQLDLTNRRAENSTNQSAAHRGSTNPYSARRNSGSERSDPFAASNYKLVSEQAIAEEERLSLTQSIEESGEHTVNTSEIVCNTFKANKK